MKKLSDELMRFAFDSPLESVCVFVLGFVCVCAIFNLVEKEFNLICRVVNRKSRATNHRLRNERRQLNGLCVQLVCNVLARFQSFEVIISFISFQDDDRNKISNTCHRICLIYRQPTMSIEIKNTVGKPSIFMHISST